KRMNRASEGQGKEFAALEGGAAARFTAAWLCFAALLCVCGTAAAQGTPLGEPVWVPLRTSPAYCADPSPVEIEVTGENTDHVTVEVEIRGYFEQQLSEQGDVYTRIFVPGSGLGGETGGPSLPFRGVEVEIPFGGGPGMELVSTETSLFVLPDPLYPQQPPVSNCDPLPSFEFDPDQYSFSELVPTDLVEMRKIGISRGQRVARVGIRPFQYRPSTGEMIAVTSLSFDVVVPDAQPHQPVPPPTRGVSGQGPDYLVIVNDYPNDIFSSCTKNGNNLVIDFARWKQRKGYRVDIATTSYIFEQLNYDYSPLGLGNYIQQIYDDSEASLAYVLLVGDASPDEDLEESGPPYYVPEFMPIHQTSKIKPNNHSCPKQVAAVLRRRGVVEFSVV
ncbi:MAG: hypothetical protein KGY81_07080, partial [Phycisphaerae bacterium]|nr:hypothetical protein [Phycisphaerae bacterium]